MIHITKICVLVLLLAMPSIVCLEAQAPPTLEDQLTTLWLQKNYTGLNALFDTEMNTTAPSVAALYSAKFFYIFVQPNKIKALSAATKLKEAANGTNNEDFIAFADEEFAEVQAIPDIEFTAPTQEILDAFHDEFSEEYPNIKIALRIKRYTAP